MNRVCGIVLVALVLGCAGGGDNGLAPVNRAPTLAFGLTKLGIAKGVPIDLSVVVSDPDGDAVSLSWTVTRGLLTAQNPSQTVMRWSVPATVGTDTVTVRASDGQASRTITEVVMVGWPTSVFPPTFLRSRSPYILSADVTSPIISIFGGQLAVVEAGVVILVDTPGTLFDVTGSFISNGTADSVVVIRPNVRGQRCGLERGWWEGIRASSASPSAGGDIEFRYTEVWYANNAVRLRDESNADIRNCAIRCSGEHGVLHDGYGSLILMDTEVTDGAGIGVSVESILALPDSVLIEGCVLRFNVADGLRVGINDAAQSVPIVMEYTRVESNFSHGVTLARQSFPRMHFNSFSGNGDLSIGVSNIYLENGYPNGAPVTQLDATCNFWGAAVTDQSSIDKTIRDSFDSGLVGVRVIVSPWLNQSPLTTPPTCTPPSP